MEAREEIFQRIRSALAIPGAVTHESRLGNDLAAASFSRKSEQELFEEFRMRAAAADTRVEHWPGGEDMLESLRRFVRNEEVRSILVSSVSSVERYALAEAVRGNDVRVSTVRELAESTAKGRSWHDAVAAFDLFIGSAAAGFADSGAVLVVAESGESRAGSLLIDRHLCLLSRIDIHPSFEEFAPRLDVQAASASILVGGPSKTADIEKVLVRGVHGPRAFAVAVIG